MKIKISPSLLSCDFSQMGQEAAKIEHAGAEWLHIDVMDGHFVPNLTFGAPVIACLRKHTPLLFDVHLMMSEPHRYIADFVKAGADIITFHVESSSDVAQTIALIHSAGKKAGLALKPATPAEAVYPYLEQLEMVLVMTVEPGFGGQKFQQATMQKLHDLRQRADEMGKSLDLQVDGGIDAQTCKIAAHNGANILVAGSYVFGSPNYAAAVAALRSGAEQCYLQQTHA